MALKVREELVGKRFASLKYGDFRKLDDSGSLKSSERCSSSSSSVGGGGVQGVGSGGAAFNSGWQHGVVRAASLRDLTDPGIKVGVCFFLC